MKLEQDVLRKTMQDVVNKCDIILQTGSLCGTGSRNAMSMWEQMVGWPYYIPMPVQIPAFIPQPQFSTPQTDHATRSSCEIGVQTESETIFEVGVQTIPGDLVTVGCQTDFLDPETAEATTEPDISYGSYVDLTCAINRLQIDSSGSWEPCEVDHIFAISDCIKVLKPFIPDSEGIQIQVQAGDMGAIMATDDGDVQIFFPSLFQQGLCPLHALQWIFPSNFEKLVHWRELKENTEDSRSISSSLEPWHCVGHSATSASIRDPAKVNRKASKKQAHK